MSLQRTDHHDALSERLFELTPDVLAVVDGHGRIVRLNRAGRELIGLDDEDLAATRLFDIVHPSDRDAMAERLSSVHDGVGESFRFRARSAVGGHRWLETRAVLGDDGLIFAVCRDITDSQDADAERLIESFTDAPLTCIAA